MVFSRPFHRWIAALTVLALLISSGMPLVRHVCTMMSQEMPSGVPCPRHAKEDQEAPATHHAKAAVTQDTMPCHQKKADSPVAPVHKASQAECCTVTATAGTVPPAFLSGSNDLSMLLPLVYLTTQVLFQTDARPAVHHYSDHDPPGNRSVARHVFLAVFLN